MLQTPLLGATLIHPVCRSPNWRCSWPTRCDSDTVPALSCIKVVSEQGAPGAIETLETSNIVTKAIDNLKSPAERATAAAEQLAAEGKPVTARTVRTRAAVMTTVASQAAKSWNERQALNLKVPEMPDSVATRLEAIWGEAYHAARQEFDVERENWTTRLEAAEAETSQIAEEADRAQEAIAQLHLDIKDVTETVAQLRKLTDEQAAALQESRLEATSAASRADAAESALKDVLAALGTLPQKQQRKSSQ